MRGVQSRRRFTIAVFLGAPLCIATVLSGAQGRTFDLLSASIADIQEAVDAGALTYERLVRLYLNRIEAYDKKGPQLRAGLAVNPRAIEIARSLDQERRTSGRRSSLHGIPVAVKDNIDVRDMPTTGGNLAFAGTYAAYDAPVVRRLREAGAIILLKTNLDELALGSRGLSSVGGQILNPYDLTRNPGGSSGGTAVAVNVGFATLGLGTETGFSIRSPASNNALVGIAPSRGLVSRAGVIPISYTQDRVGVHAKTVGDAALLLDAISGFDADDLATAEFLQRPRSPSFIAAWTGTLPGGTRRSFLKAAMTAAGAAATPGFAQAQGAGQAHGHAHQTIPSDLTLRHVGGSGRRDRFWEPETRRIKSGDRKAGWSLWRVGQWAREVVGGTPCCGTPRDYEE